MRFPTHFLRPLSVIFLITGSLVLLGTQHLQAQSNTVDPVFGGAGLGLYNDVQGLYSQPDGKVLVAGGINGLTRLNTDGTTDAGFVSSINYPPSAIAVQLDGKILCIGSPYVNGVATTGIVGGVSAIVA